MRTTAPSHYAALARIAALGAATGARTSAAFTGLAWSSSSADPAWLRSPTARALTALMAAGEAITDQLPSTKSRLIAAQLIPRAVFAAAGGAILSRRLRQPLAVGAAVAAGASLAAAFGGARLRSVAVERLGRDNYAAVGEDALVAGAASWAVR